MGGVARVLNTLMAALPKDRYEIDLLILHKRGMLMEEVPQGVHILEGTPFFTPVDESLDMIWAEKKLERAVKEAAPVVLYEDAAHYPQNPQGAEKDAAEKIRC